MPRKTTPSFVVTLPLRVSLGDERRLRDRFVCGTRLANVMIQHARTLVASMRSSEQWAAARALPRTTEEQRRTRAQAFGGIRKSYGFTKADFDAVVCQHAKAAGFYGRIGTHEMQALAERVFRGADEWLCGKRGSLRFKGRNRPLHSLSGKNNKTCLSWKPDSYELQIEAGFRLQAVLPDLKRDEWLASALMAPTKYCRLLWRNVRGQRRGDDRRARYRTQHPCLVHEHGCGCLSILRRGRPPPRTDPSAAAPPGSSAPSEQSGQLPSGWAL